jgi:hypothetical protein
MGPVPATAHGIRLPVVNVDPVGDDNVVIDDDDESNDEETQGGTS